MAFSRRWLDYSEQRLIQADDEAPDEGRSRVNPLRYDYINKKLAARGDSLTVAAGSWPDVFNSARSAAGYTRVNYAVGGTGLAEAVANLPTLLAGNPQVAALFLQANDLAGATYATGDALADALVTQWFDPVRAAGIRTVGFTSTPQAAPAGNPAIHNPKRAAFDARMRQYRDEGRIDYLVDVAADPILGPEAAASDTAIYGDGLHMTGYGYGRLGTLAIPAIDAAFGYPSDTVPAAFTIPPQTDAAKNTVVTSGSVTPTGLDTPTAISVTGGDAEIETNNSGYWRTTDTLSIGGTFKVRMTSANVDDTEVLATVTVGGVASSYSLRTAASAGTTPPVFSAGATVLYHNGGFAGTVKTWAAVPFGDGHPLFYTETDGGGREVTSITVNGIACTRIIDHATGKDLFICPTDLAAGNYDVVLTMNAGIGQVWVPYLSVDNTSNPTPVGTSQLSFAFRAGGAQTSSPSITVSGTSKGVMIGRRGAGLTISNFGPTGALITDYGNTGNNLNFFWAEFAASGQPQFNINTAGNSFLLAAAWAGDIPALTYLYIGAADRATRYVGAEINDNVRYVGAGAGIFAA